MRNQQGLMDLINQRLADGEVELPVFDDIALQIDREVRENKLDAELICKIIEEDQVLVADLLRMANSSFFSGMSPVSGLKDAAVRLGVRQIASIVFSVSQKRLYSASKGIFKSRLKNLWLHTSAVSIGARWLAANAGYRNRADEAFVAGLLHDIGKLSLLCVLEELITSEGLELTDEEVSGLLLMMHCEHGAMLLTKWNIPEFFKTIVLQQQDEEPDLNNELLCMIRLVDKACILEGIADMHFDNAIDLESMPEVKALSLTFRDLEELRAVLQSMNDDTQAAA
ncbi:HDOD domain-containing protein [Granulosicoccus antarcticus]|uniref:HDOD domain-containing protein n=1 Tax=Granulosicoccus antarcticus IMCC3135 TaxID=1192854 RepID=A0A2Z2P506_9GAMM|nr:HDOD domain-containing protein [Granulosicoccus antarcticus]ASJ74914.1 hypothetical protein IMCC3135_24230 [Granulosicoccus antarcticus IMCC3135]